MPNVFRVALIYDTLNHYVRRISLGVSRVIRPDRGMMLREFAVPPTATELNPALLAWKADAIIFFGNMHTINVIAPLLQLGLPLVSTSSLPDMEQIPQVLVDPFQCYELAHQHFEGRMAAVGRYVQGNAQQCEYYRQKYRRFTSERQLPCHLYGHDEFDELVDATTPRPEIDRRLAAWLAELPKPLGLFSTHLLLGWYLVRECVRLGYSVPHEIAIIGCDDFEISRNCQPTLTSFYQPAELVGERAAQTLLELLAGRAITGLISVAGTRLIVRESSTVSNPQEWDLDKALEWIDQHACDGLQVQDLIKQTQHIRRETFQRKFHAATGMTPRDMIEARRMQEAKQLLLQTDFSLKWISELSGYTDYLHFYKVFRKTMGVSPAKYRQMARS